MDGVKKKRGRGEWIVLQVVFKKIKMDTAKRREVSEVTGGENIFDVIPEENAIFVR